MSASLNSVSTLKGWRVNSTKRFNGMGSIGSPALVVKGHLHRLLCARWGLRQLSALLCGYTWLFPGIPLKAWAEHLFRNPCGLLSGGSPACTMFAALHTGHNVILKSSIAFSPCLQYTPNRHFWQYAPKGK